MTKARVAKGTLIKIGDGGGSEAFNTIGEVVSFSGVEWTTPTVEVPSQDSTAMERISTALPDGGKVTVGYYLIGSDTYQQQAKTDQGNGTLRNFKVILNDHATTQTTFTFSAIIESIKLAGFSGVEPYKGEMTLATSGAPVVSQWRAS